MKKLHLIFIGLTIYTSLYATEKRDSSTELVPADPVGIKSKLDIASDNQSLLVDDLPEANKEIIDTVNSVYMNTYGTNISGGLITTGVSDCVVIAFHHPIKGVYLGHFLRTNQFFRNKESGVCTKYTPNCERASIPHLDCDSQNVKSIEESLPNWIHDDGVTGYIYSGSPSRLETRDQQLFQIYHGKLIKVYGQDVIKVINQLNEDLCAEKDQNKKRKILEEMRPFLDEEQYVDPSILSRWNNSDNFILSNVFGITGDGVFFKSKFQSLSPDIKAQNGELKKLVSGEKEKCGKAEIGKTEGVYEARLEATVHTKK